MIYRILMTVLVFSASVVPAVPQDADKEKLPSGPQPFQALASVDSEGNLALKRTTTLYVPTTAPDPRNKGAMITQYDIKTSVVRTRVSSENVKAYDVRGNPIAPKRLRKQLREEIPVLVSADGKMVDALHLRLYKDDVVVLVVPLVPQAIPIASPTLTTDPAKEKSNWEQYYPPIEGPKADAKKVKLEFLGPREGRTQADTNYTIRVTNTRTVKLTGARVLIAFPDHLRPVPDLPELKQGVIQAEVGDLDPGAARDLTLTLRAQKKGDALLSATVLAEPDFTQTATLRTAFADGAPNVDKK